MLIELRATEMPRDFYLICMKLTNNSVFVLVYFFSSYNLLNKNEGSVTYKYVIYCINYNDALCLITESDKRN